MHRIVLCKRQKGINSRLTFMHIKQAASLMRSDRMCRSSMDQPSCRYYFQA